MSASSDNSARSDTRVSPGAPVSPTYFLSLELENVRCFGERQELRLCDDGEPPRQWTVLLGDNGTGKTTVLQALASLEPKQLDYDPQGPTFGLISGGYPNEVVRSFPRGGGGPTTIKAWAGAGGELGRRAPLQRGMLGWDGCDLFMMVPPSLSALICYGYGAVRRLGKAELAGNDISSGTGFRACETLFRGDASLINAEEWLLQADYASRMKSPVRKQAEARRDKVKDVLHAMLPSDVGEIRIAPPTEKRERAAVEFQTPYGWVSLRDLSLGYQTLITWMVDLGARLIERYPGSANPLAEPAIVLVDEIDLHLHPKWQRSLMGHLTERFPNTQFIVTAHSPLIVQAATDANIVLLRREGDHVVIDNDVQTVRDWRVDQVLASDLFGGIPGRPPDVAEALEERKRLLAKKKRTPGENRKLRELDERAEALPTAESPEDIEAMEIIRQAAKHLKATEETGG